MLRIPSAALAIALSLTAGAASAHSLLVNPPPLTSDDNAKSGPCGCYFGAGPEDPNDDGSPSPCPGNFPKTDLVAGEQITVSWKETVNHDGAFRLAISTQPVDGVVKADLNAGVVYDQPDTNSTSGATINAKITVPLTPCESCTLQLRQTMNGAAKPYYWSCASIRILPAGGTTSSTSTGAGSGAGGAGGGSGSGGDPAGSGGDPASGSATLSAGAGTAVPPPPFHTGACAFTATGAAGSSLGAGALLGALALLYRRRRGPRA
ncbi:MAG: SCE4755 family polysaccharide monooxygenase-like protein [Byssovorax sp.]